MSIADNIESVSRRIQKATDRCDRARAEVTLLAVSKTRTPADLLEAIAAGQRVFAESYLQEALDKMSALADQPGLEWHFIGPIQSNKTRQIANAFDWVHSVDRLKIAQRLDEQREEVIQRTQTLTDFRDILSSVLGILTVELGWIVTEVGRQPWVIQDVMRTSAGVSPGLTGTEATITLVGFVGVYTTLLGLYTYVVWRIIRNGPPSGDELRVNREETSTSGPGTPVPGVADDD